MAGKKPENVCAGCVMDVGISGVTTIHPSVHDKADKKDIENTACLICKTNLEKDGKEEDKACAILCHSSKDQDDKRRFGFACKRCCTLHGLPMITAQSPAVMTVPHEDMASSASRAPVIGSCSVCRRSVFECMEYRHWRQCMPDMATVESHMSKYRLFSGRLDWNSIVWHPHTVTDSVAHCLSARDPTTPIFSEHTGRECNDCARPERKDKLMKRCNACKSVLYCDRNCMTRAWRIHKIGCGPKTLQLPRHREKEREILGEQPCSCLDKDKELGLWTNANELICSVPGCKQPLACLTFRSMYRKLCTHDPDSEVQHLIPVRFHNTECELKFTNKSA